MKLMITLAAALLIPSGSNADSLGHPRLYFKAADLQRLRDQRSKGIHALMWRNMAKSADWCLTQTPRKDWIAPVSPDPIYLNLYNRFYGMMSDMAIMEHLAFAYAYSGDPRYLDGARKWTLNCCRVWGHEADGAADANKAYAVMRLLKGVATSYDIIYPDLTLPERNEIRKALREIGHKYYQWYLDNPQMGTMKQGAHHASVETTSFGVAALALLGEVREAQDWLDLMVKKHTDDLLPHAITPSGAQTEGPTFWASTMQYRIMFMDALRRVTGRDLFTEYAKQMDGAYALAVCANPSANLPHDETRRSIMFHPSYGQLDYFSPVLVALAREYRRPLYQRLAMWDPSLGSMQRTRYQTPDGEELVFQWGGYAYAWYDDTVQPAVEKALLSFSFPEVSQAYARSSYAPDAIVVGQNCGVTEVHAGGQGVLVERQGWFKWPKPTQTLTLQDDGSQATISSTACPELNYDSQTITLSRPGKVALARKTAVPVNWWCHTKPKRRGNTLQWPDGTVLTVTRGSITSFEPEGYQEDMAVGMGLLKCPDPMPIKYPLVTAEPDKGELVIEIHTKDAK